MKIKINLDDSPTLTEALELHNLTVFVGSVF